jgi:hypothetical protein
MYKVKFREGRPEVIDQNGALVPNSRVRRVYFPEPIFDPKSGKVVDVGRGFADITVNGQPHDDVPLM